MEIRVAAPCRVRPASPAARARRDRYPRAHGCLLGSFSGSHGCVFTPDYGPTPVSGWFACFRGAGLGRVMREVTHDWTPPGLSAVVPYLGAGRCATLCVGSCRCPVQAGWLAHPQSRLAWRAARLIKLSLLRAKRQGALALLWAGVRSPPAYARPIEEWHDPRLAGSWGLMGQVGRSSVGQVPGPEWRSAENTVPQPNGGQHERG
jgi:hypothetical protein